MKGGRVDLLAENAPDLVIVHNTTHRKDGRSKVVHDKLFHRRDRLNLEGDVGRKAKLKRAGVIRARVALVDPEAVGLGLTAFVGLSAPEQTASWQEKFERVLEEIPEVMDAYQLSGSHDYVLRIVARDMMDYERLRKRIVDAVPVRALSANFVLKRLKAETALPLDTISA